MNYRKGMGKKVGSDVGRWIVSEKNDATFVDKVYDG